MTAEKKNSYLLQILSILGFLAVIGGTILIYFYSNGWRLDPFKQEFIKTGVLTVESNPSSATIFIDGQERGRTPKSINLPIGNYSISVERDGYITWNKEITVKEEKSTPVFPWLIKEEFTKENLFTLEGESYINSWISDESPDRIYFLTEKLDPLTLIYRYNIYQYDVNRAFWDLSPNPKVTFTYDSPVQVDIQLDLSPNGQLAILALTTELGTSEYLWDIQRVTTFDDMQKLNLEIVSGYTRTWAESNDYLLFESDLDIISFNLDRQTKYLLVKKVDGKKYIWNTDNQGFFYILEDNKENVSESVFAYNLTQLALDGSNPKVLVSDIYLQKDVEYLSEYREDLNRVKYIEFKNSPESTKSVSDIVSFNVNQSAKGVYISTQESSYWYNMNTQMYVIVSPYPTTFIGFSPDNKKFLFQDSMGYAIFTFEKDNGDHTVTIGTKYIKDLEDAENIGWLSNSTNLSYTKGNILYLIDKDGDNITKMLDISGYKYTGFNYSKDRIYAITISNIDGIFTIDSFLTH